MADVLESEAFARSLARLSSLEDEARAGRDSYGRFSKPRVAEMLEAMGLDVAYSRAEGDYLFYEDASGSEVRVLDMLGGFGASLLGHNHPLLVARARAALGAGRPFNAQASVRELAGRLAERLSERVKRSTSRDYVVTFAATGAEAIEAALKLAELDRTSRVAQLLQEATKAGRGSRPRAARGAFERASRYLGEEIASDAALVGRVAARAERSLDVPPVFLCLERAFHGKTTGALSLTANARFRSAWRHIGLQTTFLPAGDGRALKDAIDAARVRYLALRLDADGAIDVEERSFVPVAAAFVEPIQGEGGVRLVPDAYLRALRAAADEHGFLLVFDEIQCGMGRTGTFLASEPSGVRADAYALSKSLGGGLAKISALLVDRARYEPEFGLLHTSTFADDDFASGVALGVLELLDRDDGELLRSCRAKGEHLTGRLDALAKKYPGQIREVRGRGLMVGLELVRASDSASPFLRVASDQGLLGYVVAGHLLHEERIRVAPTLSSPETIRLQPSAYVEVAELDRFCEAIERVAVAIRDRDVLRLTGHLVGRSRVTPTAVAPPPLPTAPPARSSRRVAFLGHFLAPQHLRDWEPGFAPLSPDECLAMLERTRRALDPFVAHEATIRSARGGDVDVTIIGLPFSPEQVMAGFRSGSAVWARDLVGRGLELAKARGARVVGFGGYTSIVSDNCRAFADAGVLVTSGNSLASAATVEAVLAAKARLRLGHVRLGVVGALGNIGAVLAELLAEHVEEIVLLGRPGARRRLEEREDRIYAAALRRKRETGEARGIARAAGLEPDALLAPAGRNGGGELSFGALIAGMTEVAAGEALARSIDGDGAGLGALIRRALGAAAPIVVATDPTALRACNVIVAATNAPHPVILPEHLGPSPLVICDVAVPGDVDPRVLQERPDVTVLEGGLVSLPFGQRLRIPGMPQGGAEIFGCLAETILTGLADLDESLSLGALRAEDVRTVRDLARAHGLSFGEKALPHGRPRPEAGVAP